MRQQRTFTLLAVVTAVLVMSIVYAAINNVNFNITGNALATPDQGSFDIKFLGQPSVSGNGKASITMTGSTSAIMNVSGLSSGGDYVEALFTIKNNSSDLDAIVYKSVSGGSGEVYISSYFIGTETGTIRDSFYSGEHEYIPAGETATLVVRVAVNRTLIQDVKTNINIKVTAEPNYMMSYYGI